MNQQPPQPPYGQPQWGQPLLQQPPPQPPYGQPLPQQALQFTPSDQNNTSVKTGGAIIAIVIFLSIFGIFQISSHQNSSLDSTQSSTPSPVVANVGGTITVDDISCTLTSANINIAPGYITVQMKLTNNSGKEYTIYGSDFVVKNSSGLIINSDAPGEAKLAPGGSAEFHLDFQVDDPHSAELFWQPTDLELFNDLTHYWNLGL